MKIVPPDVTVLTPISDGGVEELKRIELIGRSCYGSEDKITEDSARDFVANLIARGHETPIEHSQLTVMFQTDRGISHELVRHRLCSLMQSSTRYQDYSDDKYGGEISVIDPHPFIRHETLAYREWRKGCEYAEYYYFALLHKGCKPELARTVLPNSLMTKLTVTANYREWRHILTLRLGKGAHPQMKQLMILLAAHLKGKIPVIFDDISLSTDGLLLFD